MARIIYTLAILAILGIATLAIVFIPPLFAIYG